MPIQRTYFELGRIQTSGDWFWYGIGLTILMGWIAWTYRRDTPGRPLWVRGLFITLRICVLLIIFGVFLDPQLRTETVVKRPSRVILLADTSLSMSLKDEQNDQGERKSRDAQLTTALAESEFLDRLRDRNEVAVYGFGRELDRVAFLEKRDTVSSQESKDPAVPWEEKLRSRQDQSRVGDSIIDALRMEANAPLAAIVVLSDGRVNAGSDIAAAIEEARRRDVPVHTVTIGSDVMPQNLRVTNLVMPTRVFTGDEVRITAAVQGTELGANRATVTVTLEDATNPQSTKLLSSEKIALPTDGSPAPLEVKHLPDKVGSWQIRIHASVIVDEIRLDDNTVIGGLEVIDQKTKVLILAGGPSREYQFLRNLLHRDKSMELSVCLQSALDPIAQDAAHVLSHFPTTREELFAQDVLIAMDPAWSELEPAQRELIVDWVSEHSGGLILVAGPIHTPQLARDATLDEIQQLYPVELKSIFTSDMQPGSESQAWPIRLSREGEDAEALRLDDDAAVSKRLWLDFAGFFWCYPVNSIKPGATVLGQFTDPRSAVGGLAPPVFATQFYGAGRIFYLGSGEMWRIRRLSEQLYDRWWIRIVRQYAQGRLLQGSGRGAILLEADRFTLGSTIPIRARVLDAEFRPLATEKLPLSVAVPSGQTKEIELKAERDQAGRFQGLLVASEPGEYRLRLGLPDSTDVIERRLQVTVPDIELNDPRADSGLLARLAKETGGLSFSSKELETLADRIEDRTETSVYSGVPTTLWDRGWVIAVVVILLGAEWLLRKVYSLS